MSRRHHQRLPTRHCGTSLAEVLIALAISMVIAAAMASLFAQSVQSRQKVDSEGQRIESGRYALDAMADDIRMAGFYGDYMPRSSTSMAWPATSEATGTTWTAPDPCATTLATLGWDNGVTGPAAIGSGTVRVPVAIFGYEGGHVSATPAGLPACLLNYKPGTDVIVVRRVSTMAPSATAGSSALTDTTAMTAGEAYLQASTCKTQTPTFVVSSTAANFTMQNLRCLGSTISPLRKVVVRIYYVATCNTCVPSDGIPTLKVAELGVPGSNADSVYHSDTNNFAANRVGTLSMMIRSLTPGIENMHFEYGVDGSTDNTTGAGSADSYQVSTEAPTVSAPLLNAASAAVGWQNVMSVKAWVLARDLDQTAGYVNNKAYVMGTQTISAFDDAYRRNVFASTIRVVNPASAREIP